MFLSLPCLSSTENWKSGPTSGPCFPTCGNRERLSKTPTWWHSFTETRFTTRPKTIPRAGRPKSFWGNSGMDPSGPLPSTFTPAPPGLEKCYEERSIRWGSVYSLPAVWRGLSSRLAGDHGREFVPVDETSPSRSELLRLREWALLSIPKNHRLPHGHGEIRRIGKADERAAGSEHSPGIGIGRLD